MFFQRLLIDSIQINPSRDDLVRRSRVLVVDDERPELIEDLQKAGFAVDYAADIDNENMQVIEQPLYDLLLLDFGQVGRSFGSDEGLSLLRHIKRLNPSLVVLAYTSRSLGTEHADFYRIADGVLAKDAGIQESLEKIEEGLTKAHSIRNLWSGILAATALEPGSSEDKRLQDLLVRGLQNRRKIRSFKKQLLARLGGRAAQKLGTALLGKILELGLRSYVGV